MDRLEAARTAVSGAAIARDRNEDDVAFIYLALADMAILRAQEELSQVKGASDAIRKELARRHAQLVGGAQIEMVTK